MTTPHTRRRGDAAIFALAAIAIVAINGILQSQRTRTELLAPELDRIRALESEVADMHGRLSTWSLLPGRRCWGLTAPESEIPVRHPNACEVCRRVEPRLPEAGR